MNKIGIFAMILLFLSFFEALLSLGLIGRYIDLNSSEQESLLKYIYPNFYNTRNGLLLMDLIYMFLSFLGIISIFVSKKNFSKFLFFGLAGKFKISNFYFNPKKKVFFNNSLFLNDFF